jgi:hypothetical protein
MESVNPCGWSLFKQFQRWQTVNFDAVQGLTPWLTLFPKRDDRDLVTCFSEQSGFVPDTSVLWKIVLNPH